MKIYIKKIEAFFFDFDGVITDNLVYVDEKGKESVSCSRADGLAFDVLRKLNKPSFIISTEKNSVVKIRANKLKIPVFQGVLNKVEVIKKVAYKNKYNHENILYVGNDLNDYNAMKFCGYSVCPADSHTKIKKISNIILKSNGGNGAVRELLEDILNIDFVKVLY
jgi:YrbI family 3-deoxy-D-manno-octulosonate 8-phosphate phosphatase|tara:strand:- start:2611 stop:3105 length:495 start_codon:yes stop_codon:yes gene_type:complete